MTDFTVHGSYRADIQDALRICDGDCERCTGDCFAAEVALLVEGGDAYAEFRCRWDGCDGLANVPDWFEFCDRREREDLEREISEGFTAHAERDAPPPVLDRRQHPGYCLEQWRHLMARARESLRSARDSWERGHYDVAVWCILRAASWREDAKAHLADARRALAARSAAVAKCGQQPELAAAAPAQVT